MAVGSVQRVGTLKLFVEALAAWPLVESEKLLEPLDYSAVH